MQYPNTRIVLSLIAAVSVSTSVVMAQEIAPTEPTTGEEPTEAPDVAPSSATTDEEANIVVLPEFVTTATKVARPLQDEPMSVQITTGEALDSFKLFDAKDVAVVTPGLNIDATNPQNPVPSLRGITYDSVSGTSPTVDIYWNEIPVTTQTAFTAIYDVGQMEVLRGPQGTLRGRTSPGGAILIGTRRPDLENFQGSIQQSFSSLDVCNSQLAVNLPLVSGKLALRVAGLYNANNMGDIENVILGVHSRSHTRSIRASLEWKPTENIDLLLVHQILRNEYSTYLPAMGTDIFDRSSQPPFPSELSYRDRKSIDQYPAHFENNPDLTTLTADLKLPGDHQLSIVLGRQQSSYLWDSNNGNPLNVIPNYEARQTVDVTNLPATYSVEARFFSVNHSRWDYVFGCYFEHTSAGNVGLDTVTSPVYFFPVSTPTTPHAVVLIDDGLSIGDGTDQRGLFTTQTLKLGEKWRIEVGARMQDIKTSGRQYLPLYMQGEGFRQPLGILESESSIDDNPTTGSANISYRLSPEVNFYLNAGTSYRSGGTGFNTYGPAYDEYYRYDSETSTGIELGAKTSLLNRKLQLNADVFMQKFDGYQSFGYVPLRASLDPEDNDVMANAALTYNGDTEVKGIEIGMTTSLPYRIVLNLDAAYVNAVWADGVTVPGTSQDENGEYLFDEGEYVAYVPVGGERIGNTPKFTATARLEWSHPMRNVEFFARGLFRYKSDRQLNTANRDIVGGYGISDLFAGLRSKKGTWEMTVWVKNVFDKQTADSFQDLETVGGFISGFRRVTLAPPRELGTTLTYNF